MITVRDIGEFGLIRKLQKIIESNRPSRSSVVVGIGDDCAVLRSGDPGKLLLYTCDPMVEGVHYLAQTPPRQIGWKAMARNLSDIAAMGGLPRWAVVSIGLRPATPVKYVERIYDGLRAAAGKFGCQIVGGDTAHVRREQFVVVALLGEVEKSTLTLRSGAKIGDSVLVTGTLGGSLRGKHLKFTPRVAEARWLAQNFPIHAMIDLSDGLSGDLQRLVEAGKNRVGFEVFAAEVPISPAARGSLNAALNDGEDFELLFTIDPRNVTTLRKQWLRKFKLQLTEIGSVVRSPGKVSLVTANGRKRFLTHSGYDHFAS
jgi:thiamine-monophosphate kinase